MKVALTGTPGTGKSSISGILSKKYKVIHLGDITEARVEYDDTRDSYVVDTDMLRNKVDGIKDEGIIIVEGHYAHDMAVDMVIVLRCHPDVLKNRLEKRGYKASKIRENMEAEAMGIIVDEALGRYPENKVYEVDTSKINPEEGAAIVEKIINGRGEEYLKRISYMEEILKWY